LNNKLSEKDAEIEAKERQMAELMERIAELEKKK
jgi:hypothetical protein